MKMQTAKPTRKLIAGGISGLTIGSAVTTIVVYLIETMSGQLLPNTIQTAIGTLITTAAVVGVGYLTSPSDADVPVEEPPKP